MSEGKSKSILYCCGGIILVVIVLAIFGNMLPETAGLSIYEADFDDSIEISNNTTSVEISGDVDVYDNVRFTSHDLNISNEKFNLTSDGGFSTTFTIPLDLNETSITITASGGDSDSPTSKTIKILRVQEEDNIASIVTVNKTSPTKTSKSTRKYDASGYCGYVVDGDTIDVDGVGRIRFVGVNTPERGDPGYSTAKTYIKNQCLGKTIYLDIDDAKRTDRYGRVLAVVYVNGVNINQRLLQLNYAEVMYIPPSEFNPYSWT